MHEHHPKVQHVHDRGGGPILAGPHAGHTVEAFRKRFWISLIVTVPILLLTPQVQNILGLSGAIGSLGRNFQNIQNLLLFVLSSFIYFYGGYPFLQGLYREIRDKMPGMMTLIGVAITTAYTYSSATVFGLAGMPFFWELATLIDIMLLGHWMEMKSISGASRALEQLVMLMPSVAHRIERPKEPTEEQSKEIAEEHTMRSHKMPESVLDVNRENGVIDVELDELTIGDLVLVKPGEKVPADGIVVDGKSSVDEALLTGESKPINKTAGSMVIGGSINGEGALTVEVRKMGEDSFLSQVVELVRKAQESKSRAQDVSNRVAFWLTIIALSVGALTFAVWKSVLSQNIAFSLERAVTVMVIACPHALGLAVPLVIAISTSIAAQNGLLIRSRVAFENARNIQAVIFDKTGTLTEGKFGVTDVVSFNSNMDNANVLKYAAAIEAFSEHPIARAIIAANEKQSVTQTNKQTEEHAQTGKQARNFAAKDMDKEAEVDAGKRFKVIDFSNITGEGVQAMVDGKNVKIVSPAYLKEHAINFPETERKAKAVLEKLTGQGKTVVVLVIEDNVEGAIALADVVRAESKLAVNDLKSMGIRCIMMTGDNEQVAKWVSGELGLDEYFAEVLPQQKADKVKEVQERGLIVAMTGDGVNDAPALAQADVGIAIGSGTDVAIETADIVLIRSNPEDVVNIIKLARSTYSKMAQNLAWATGYNAFAIPLAAGVLYGYGILLSPALGAVLMSLSTIIVAINARLLRL